MARLLVFLAFIIQVLCLKAQVNPKPGAKLNYNQVMFEGEKVKGAGTYIFQIAYDTAGGSFSCLVIQQKDSAPATLVSGLQFGKKYQWRYAGSLPGQPLQWRGPYNFEISIDSLFHFPLMNFEVLANDSNANAGGLIINDCTHTIVDRSGNLVWYLPKIFWRETKEKQNLTVKPQMFDLRLNPSGTVTFLANAVACETDLDGNTLWKGPDDGKVSGSNTELYNHDFKRLPNGHYMLLGGEQWRKLPPYKDTALIQKKYPSRKIIDGHECGEVELQTIIEYDKKGNVVWSWKGENYFEPDPFDTTRSVFERKPHANAFSQDGKGEFIYMGLRNASRIIKIEKKTGQVVNCWGDPTVARQPAKAVPFRRQHDANILDDGTIAVFNNNDYPGLDSFASVMLISQRPADSSHNYVAWSFKCDFDTLHRTDERNGGNVDQLKNGNLLVCTGSMNRIFEVTRNKKIVWDATLVPERKPGKKYVYRSYRAHYLSSLYPCYFTFVTDEDALSPGQSYIHLKLFNKGSESDVYNIQVKSTTGNPLADINTKTGPANSSVSINIKPSHTLKADDHIEVTVTSKTNPDFERSSTLTVVK